MYNFPLTLSRAVKLSKQSIQGFNLQMTTGLICENAFINVNYLHEEQM